MLDRDALGQGIAAERQMNALDGAFHRRIELGLDSDQLQVRLDRAGRDRHARHQPAAADRDHDQVEVGRILEHFERDRPGARDHLRIVERVDEAIAFLERELAGARIGVVEHVAVEHDGGAVPFGLGDLHRRGGRGHDDDRRDAEALA